MPESAHAPKVVRFGVFDVDMQAGQLRKAGLRVKLQEQPFQVLAALLGRPGEVVTREELRERLWPADTFVDFDLSLNGALKKLRYALGDVADSPTFIETIPRRGYRFIGTVSGDQPAANQRAPLRGGSKSKSVVAGLAVLVLIGVQVWAFWPALVPPKVVGSVQITSDRLPKLNFVGDDARLYVTETVNGHSILNQVSAEGGEISRIPTPFPNVNVVGIAPNHSELLVTSFVTGAEAESPLWLLPIPSGSPRRLGEVIARDGAWSPLGRHGAGWSPDGREIVYVNGSSLYLAKSDGSETRALATVAGVPYAPVFSPDGSRLRFTVFDPKTAFQSLWEIAADGSAMHPLLSGRNKELNECCGTWTPDGQYFVFESQDSNGSTLWIRMEKAGRFRKIAPEPVQLTTGPLSFRNPVVSKDGKKLFVIGQQKRGELVRYDGRSRQFVPFLGGISASFVDFSRDGQWIAYVTYPEGVLWRSRADGSDRLQLTPPLGVGMPRWSPDGTRIAFLGCAEGKPLKIFLVSAEGGNPQEVLPEGRSEGDPTWSPDGSSLSFGRTPDLELGAFGPAPIQILDLKSGQVSAVPGSEGLYAVSWSPDGRYLSAMTSDSSKLMLFDFTTKKWLELAKGSFAYPGWSHDGKYIYFEDFGKGEIRRVEVSSQKFESVAGITELRRPGHYEGIWSAPAYDGSPMLMRDIGIEEIYALDLHLP